MAPIKSCIFSPLEAQAIAAGDAAKTASLKQEICSALPAKPSKELQKKFKSVVAAAPKAVAFLWRGKKLEAFEQGRMPTEKSCAKTATPLRCDAVVALGQGKLSHMTAVEEEKVLGPATCDWRTKEAEESKAWMQYYNQHKAVLADPIKRAALIRTFPGYSASFESRWNLIAGPRQFSENDARLLGTLVLIYSYLRRSKYQFVANLPLLDMFCAQKIDCTVIST